MNGPRTWSVWRVVHVDTATSVSMGAAPQHRTGHGGPARQAAEPLSAIGIHLGASQIIIVVHRTYKDRSRFFTFSCRLIMRFTPIHMWFASRILVTDVHIPFPATMFRDTRLRTISQIHNLHAITFTIYLNKIRAQPNLHVIHKRQIAGFRD